MSQISREVDRAIAKENAVPQGLPASALRGMEADIRANPERYPLVTAILNGDSVYTVIGIPKDSDEDMTDGVGIPKETFLTEEEAEEYIDRNSSPDNYEHYRIQAQS